MRQVRPGLTVLRILIGMLFLGHGLQKLKGWFGGHGIEGTAKGFGSMGLEPARAQATAAGLTEATAGGLLVAGLATPLASSMVTGVMAVAVHKVHARNGVWNTQGGFEYNAVLVASALALAVEGPGALSLDERLGITRTGVGWGAAELGAGLLGAVAVELVAKRAADKRRGPSTETEAIEQVLDLRDDGAPAEAGPVTTPAQAPAR